MRIPVLSSIALFRGRSSLSRINVYGRQLTDLNELTPSDTYMRRKLTIIVSDNGILLIRTLGTNCSLILSEIHLFSFKKMHMKMSSAK